MLLLKRKNKLKKVKPTKSQRLIGVMVNKRLFSYLSLVAAAEGVSKSYILRRIVEHWYSKVRKDEQKYIDTITRRIVTLFKSDPFRYGEEEGKTSLEDFKAELQRKGVEEGIILKIMKNVKKDKDSNQDS